MAEKLYDNEDGSSTFVSFEPTSGPGVDATFDRIYPACVSEQALRKAKRIQDAGRNGKSKSGEIQCQLIITKAQYQNILDMCPEAKRHPELIVTMAKRLGYTNLITGK